MVRLLTNLYHFVSVLLSFHLTFFPSFGLDGLLPTRPGSKEERRWNIPGNDGTRLVGNVLQPDFVDTEFWRCHFRVLLDIFRRLHTVMMDDIEAKTTIMRPSLKVQKKVAAFLIYLTFRTCSEVADQLSIGASTVPQIIKEISRCSCKYFSWVLQFSSGCSECCVRYGIIQENGRTALLRWNSYSLATMSFGAAFRVPRLQSMCELCSFLNYKRRPKVTFFPSYFLSILLSLYLTLFLFNFLSISLIFFILSLHLTSFPSHFLSILHSI